MHLNLQNGNKERLLTIQLVEGHHPKITDLSNDDTRSITENLESAIWFKLMVVESINVDCLNRVVSWTNGMKDKDNNLIMNTVYGGDRSCYDFDDDVDELFNLGEFLINKNPVCESNEIMEYERSAIRILHCYVLSKVIIQPCDIECVRNALTAQYKSIAQLEDTVLVHSRLAEHYLAQLQNIRELEILPVLDQLIEGSMVDKDFIDALFTDLKKAELVIRNEFDAGQKRVDHIKEKLFNAKSSQLSHELECARHERNHLFTNLQLHLVGRELCRHAGGESKGFVEMNDNCVRYMKLRKRLFAEKKIANETIAKKLRAVSVRECIESVIKDLETGEESTGDDETVDGQRVTDVIVGEKCAPEWQTLTQRLSSIVYNKEHPVGIAFHNFCSDLILNYRQILLSIEHLASDPATLASTYDDFYVVSERDFGLTKFFLENQRNVISAHIYQLTELLAEGFRNNWNMFVRKIRLCYEKCFYNRIGRDLMKMYRLVYSKSMQSLEDRITKLKSFEICKLDLQMKDEWWLELFEMEAENSEVNGQISYPYGFPGYAADSEGEFDDKVDFTTDFEEDEYSDLGGKSGGMREKLLASKNQVLSRSCFDLYAPESSPSVDLLKVHSKVLEEEITQRANTEKPRFKSEVMTRYLEDDELSGDQILFRNKTWNGEDVKRTDSVAMCVPHVPIKPRSKSIRPNDSFELHFGRALRAIKNIFSNPSPLKKMQCLTAALKIIAVKVEELRLRDRDPNLVDRAEIAVTAEDLLPLLVLIILKMAPHDAAKLYVDLLFVSDLMADFLSSGCHSYALCEFQIAFRVLDQTCEELDIA